MPHSESSDRPANFPDGMPVGLHMAVERALSTGSHRTFYVANNFKPRWNSRMCWKCGNKHHARQAESCAYCQTPLRARRFLLSSRWGPSVQGFHAFASKRLEHAGVLSPIVLYQYETQLLAFYELLDDALMMDEPCPLHPRTLLTAAYSLTGGLAHLHEQGITLDRILPEHVLLHRERARLFDIDVRHVRSRAVDPGSAAARENTCQLAAVLLNFVPLDQPEIREFFEDATDDVYPGPVAMQRDLRAFARELRLSIPTADHAVLSVVGHQRPHNEDSWGWRPLQQCTLYAIADGMGGYEAGDEASARAVQAALELLATRLVTRPSLKDATTIFTAACIAANNAVLELSRATESPCGTTLVLAALWADGTVHLAHVGDSRAYRYAQGVLTPLTEDHSMVAAMVADGKLTRDEARLHPKANVLLQHIGSRTEPEPDVQEVKLAAGEELLLCTDGLWGEVPDTALRDLVSASQSLRRKVRTLVRAANDAGGKDNITALLVRGTAPGVPESRSSVQATAASQPKTPTLPATPARPAPAPSPSVAAPPAPTPATDAKADGPPASPEGVEKP